jgi:hypothetical protein
MYRDTYYSQFFRLLTVFLSLFFFACRNNEEKLMLTEQRVLDETTFGRQMRDYMKSKNTPYIPDESLPFQSRYSIVDDSIHYNSKFNPSLDLWKKELLLGRPIRTILKFHENLHRTQVSYSERGNFFSFFRENGKIEEELLKNGKSVYEFTLMVDRGDEGKLLNFAGSLVGYPITDLSTASEVVRQKMDEMNAVNKEKLLLDEIHAYIGSDILNSDEIYAQLYETKGKGYDNLPPISLSDLSNITALIVNLYGFFQGNHDEVCKVIGKSKSRKDFQKRVQSILWGTSEEELNQKVNNWILLKKEWTEATQRIANEVLK